MTVYATFGKTCIAGTIPALTANIAENAVLFTAYGYCQKVTFLSCINKWWDHSR